MAFDVFVCVLNFSFARNFNVAVCCCYFWLVCFFFSISSFSYDCLCKVACSWSYSVAQFTSKLWTVTLWSYTVIMFFNLFYCFVFAIAVTTASSAELYAWDDFIFFFVCFNASGEIVVHFILLLVVFFSLILYYWLQFYCLFFVLLLSFEKSMKKIDRPFRIVILKWFSFSAK